MSNGELSHHVKKRPQIILSAHFLVDNNWIKLKNVCSKPLPNGRNMQTQHIDIATPLGETCCARLATLLRQVGCWWLKFDHFQTRAYNTQYVATQWPNACNMSHPSMLRSFGRGWTWSEHRMLKFAFLHNWVAKLRTTWILWSWLLSIASSMYTCMSGSAQHV